MMEFSLDLQTLGWIDAIMRVGLALVFGFLLGYERDAKNKPVDFRVYMIVAASTCLLIIMGQEVVAQYAASDNGNAVHIGLFRIVQGVLVGIGFLGAGAIMKPEHPENNDEKIVGSATGASIWASGAIGMMLGFGLYGLACLNFAVLAIILVVFGLLHEKLFSSSEK